MSPLMLIGGLLAIVWMMGTKKSAAQTAAPPPIPKPTTVSPAASTSSTKPTYVPPAAPPAQTATTTEAPPVAPPEPALPSQNTSAQLTGAEQELLSGSAAGLYINGRISAHKAFVAAAANALASAGDTRAEDLTARVAAWSPAVASAGLTTDERQVYENTGNFTLDEIAGTAGQSANKGFVAWAAWYLTSNGRGAQADALLSMFPV